MKLQYMGGHFIIEAETRSQGHKEASELKKSKILPFGITLSISKVRSGVLLLQTWTSWP
jgi:hypothetical protein